MKKYKMKEHERRKKEIYRIATQTLWQKGYDKTTIRDIAKATDMTTAGLYYYFKSKEELLFQILDSHMDDMLTGIEKIAATQVPPIELIKKYIQYQVDTYCKDKFRSKLILNDDDCLPGNGMSRSNRNKDHSWCSGETRWTIFAGTRAFPQIISPWMPTAWSVCATGSTAGKTPKEISNPKPWAKKFSTPLFSA